VSGSSGHSGACSQQRETSTGYAQLARHISCKPGRAPPASPFTRRNTSRSWESETARRDSQERLLYTAIIGIVKLAAAAACAVFAVDTIDRRKSLITGVTMQLVCISYIATVLSVVPELAEGESTPETRRVGISAIVSMYLYGAGYAFGWNSLSYIITSEIFPLQARTVGTAVVMLVHYGSRYGLQKAVPLMLLEGTMRPLGTFWFFSGMTLTGICWVWAWLPETGNMQLEKAAYTLKDVDPKGDPWSDGHSLSQR
jgi:hypothetical protein